MSYLPPSSSFFLETSRALDNARGAHVLCMCKTLKDKKVLSDAQYAHAHAYLHKHTHASLAQALATWLSEEELLEKMEKHLNVRVFPGYEAVHLNSFPQTMRPYITKVHLSACPFFYQKDQNMMHVAMVDAGDVIMEDNIGNRFGARVKSYQMFENGLAALKEYVHTQLQHLQANAHTNTSFNYYESAQSAADLDAQSKMKTHSAMQSKPFLRHDLHHTASKNHTHTDATLVSEEQNRATNYSTKDKAHPNHSNHSNRTSFHTRMDTSARKHFHDMEDAPKEESPFPSATGQDTLASHSYDVKAHTSPLLLRDLVAAALRARASDIHLQPFEKYGIVRFRIDGILCEIQRIEGEMWQKLISQIKVLGHMDIAQTRAPQHGRIQQSFAGRKVDCRISSHPTLYGENIVMRLLDTQKSLQSLDELGFNERTLETLRLSIQHQSGMILFTGPTGSGKTTSLYALLQEMDHSTRHIATLEQPIEYNLPNIRQSEVTAHMSFAQGVRSLLRQDPDVLLIGEIRDEETANMAMRAAMTGHLVLSTLHAQDVLSIPYRLINLGIDKDLIASHVLCLASQRLVRKRCTACNGHTMRSALKTPQNDLGFTGEHLQKISMDGHTREAELCSHCHGLGFKGRVCVSESVMMTPAMHRSIREAGSFHILQDVNPYTLWDDAKEKIAQGVTTYDEAVRILGPER